MNGPDIRNLMRSQVFSDYLDEYENEAWTRIKDVIENFLGKHRAPDYKERVRKMIKALHRAGVRMSLKIHFLADHLEDFPPNCGDYSDEQVLAFFRIFFINFEVILLLIFHFIL